MATSDAAAAAAARAFTSWTPASVSARDAYLAKWAAVDPELSYEPLKAWEQLSTWQHFRDLDYEIVDPSTPKPPDHIRFVCISDTHARLEFDASKVIVRACVPYVDSLSADLAVDPTSLGISSASCPSLSVDPSFVWRLLVHLQ